MSKREEGGWLYRICEKCNKEYAIPLDGRTCYNFGPCPLCGERDDVWIRLDISKLLLALPLKDRVMEWEWEAIVHLVQVLNGRIGKLVIFGHKEKRQEISAIAERLDKAVGPVRDLIDPDVEPPAADRGEER